MQGSFLLFFFFPLFGVVMVTHELKEGKIVGTGAVLVNKLGREVSTENGLDIAFRYTSQQGIQTKLVEQELGEGLGEHCTSKRDIVPEVGVLKLLVQLHNSYRQVVG